MVPSTFDSLRTLFITDLTPKKFLLADNPLKVSSRTIENPERRI